MKKSGIFTTKEIIEKDEKKFYVLDMFPYPSGDGLHVGHLRGYVATDVATRFKVLQKYNVLHPMGWDAFGLPAENYAIKNKVHPREAVEKNIAKFKSQLEKVEFTYDWTREINTTDPEYYKWTQWIFLQMFKKGLAYESNEPINWCPSCKTGLANEDLEDGKCERCNTPIEQKPMRQWVLKMTDYADRLLEDLKLLDWEEEILEQQRNWIGRSEGAEVDFRIKNQEVGIRKEELGGKGLDSRLRGNDRGGRENDILRVFTTRPDTLFGCTYMVVSPEHSLIQNQESKIENIEEVRKYIADARKKSEIERTDATKEKTGVKIEGIVAINPVNSKEIPIYVADYVLSGYGTGAIMAVPAHDKRDFEFAKKFGIEVVEVIKYAQEVAIKKQECFSGEGVNINSDFLDGLSTKEAKEKIIAWLEEKKLGTKKVNYKMRDWVFSRQRYWGEPIPLLHCAKCGVVAVPEEKLPVQLPDVKNYEPTGTGESPLANMTEWINEEKCPQCGGPAKRETNTMPQWAGSCWYYLRYIDPKNKKVLVDKKKEKAWMPVDLYVGGAEHATRHLLYARFWHKFLKDIGVVSTEEPFKKLLHVGLILAEDGRKMSKRWGNVINPDGIADKYGADALKMYIMFMGPFNQPVAWNMQGVVGMKRFLDKVNGMESRIKNQKSSNQNLDKLLHQTIKKVFSDIELFRFNTAISAMMILANEIVQEESVSKEVFEQFLIILSPFAPHLTEELWQKLGHSESIFKEEWPKYDEALAKEDKISLIVQVNGKLRDTIEVDADSLTEEKAKELALASEKVQKWLEGKEPKKVIFVKNKLVSIVV